uniref:Uncharacterized protein n=1 Tax=Aegilops tauschii TaxID=37682 RepID=M8B0U9_AEGTA
MQNWENLSMLIGAISDGPVRNNRDTSLGSLVDEPKTPDKVLLTEAVPSNLCKHSVEAWVECPYTALGDDQERRKVGEVWGDGGFAAALPSARRTVGRAVDALAVGVAAGPVIVCVAVQLATNDTHGVATDDHEAVARGRWKQIQ